MLATARLSTPNGTPPTTTQQVTAPSTATPHLPIWAPWSCSSHLFQVPKAHSQKPTKYLNYNYSNPLYPPKPGLSDPPAIIQTTFPIFPTTLIDRRGPPTTCGTDGNLYFTELAQDKAGKLQIKPTPAGPATYFYNLSGA